MREDMYSTRSYIVRLTFDVFNDKGTYKGCEDWYLGKGEIVSNVYEAQIFQSECKAVTTFYACYRTFIKKFVRESIVDRQWDGFSHVEKLYAHTIRTDQFDPFEVNNIKE